MQSMNRIAVVVIVGLAAAGSIGWYRTHKAQAIHNRSLGGTYTFCFPASQMQGRVSAYRKQFVKNYLQARNPYSMFEAMTQAKTEPLSLDDEKKIGARGPFVFSSGNVLTNDASGRHVCAPGPICDSGDFPVSLGGSNYTVRVDLPPIINVQVSDGTALVFDFGPGIPLHVSNPGSTPIPVLRQDMNFKSVSLSDSTLQEVVTSPATVDDGALTVTINLDLTGGCNASDEKRSVQ